MTHHIVWTHDRDHVEARATCDDPECLNRYVCIDGECETYYGVRREPDGSVTHKQWDDDERQVVNRHRMEKTDDCSVLDFLNADTYMIPELTTDDAAPFEIARTPIDLEWQGDDGVLWKPTSSDASTGPGA